MSIINESKTGVEYLTLNSSFGSIKGFVNKDYPNVAQFLGIRFAEPPKGPFRWLPPVLKAPAEPTETIDGTAFSPSCPQWTGGPAVVYNSVCTEFNIRDETDEDCLSVSIWAPEKAAKNPAEYKLPVIVLITGGAFLIGGSTVPYQNPTPWVESSQRHIVVCVNYRLGIFGFPCAAGLKPDEQNLGLLDQRLGLEWVHKHISSFGGDPERLTHFGQSAGAKSVDTHLFAYPDKPLLAGAIMNSGTALLPLPAKRNTDFGHYSFVAEKLGFEGDDTQAELHFMRQQSAQALLDVITAQFWTRGEPLLNFRPVVDGVTIFDDYEGLSKAGKFAHLPLITGTTENEGNSLVKYDPEGVDLEKARRSTRNMFLDPARRTVEARSQYAPTFRYLYKDISSPGKSSFPNIAPHPWLRAYHSSDLPLIFGTHSWFRGPSTALEEKVSRRWQELYVLFAEEGPTGLRRLGWNDASHGEGIIIGGDEGWKSVKLDEIDGQAVGIVKL